MKLTRWVDIRRLQEIIQLHGGKTLLLKALCFGRYAIAIIKQVDK